MTLNFAVMPVNQTIMDVLKNMMVNGGMTGLSSANLFCGSCGLALINFGG